MPCNATQYPIGITAAWGVNEEIDNHILATYGSCEYPPPPTISRNSEAIMNLV